MYTIELIPKKLHARFKTAGGEKFHCYFLMMNTQLPLNYLEELGFNEEMCGSPPEVGYKK